MSLFGSSQPAGAKTPKERLLADAEALLSYAGEQHKLTADSPDASELLRTRLVIPLSQAIANYKSAAGRDEIERRGTLLFYYSALTKLTDPVTGRSVRSSLNRRAYSSWPVYLTLALLALTIAMEAGLFGPATESPWIDYGRPLGWGAVGSCLFLLKFLSDKIAAFEFDERQLKGFSTRIAIGAILGMVVVKLFDLNYSQGSLTPSAAAFLSGLGAKVIYGALENVIDALAERLSYSAFKKDAPVPAETAQSIPAPAAGMSAATQREAPTAAIEGRQPFSTLLAVKQQLAARGFTPGPIDSSPSAKTTGAIQDFLKASGKTATADQVAQANPATLLQWLRDGKIPDNWESEIKLAPTDQPDTAGEDVENAAIIELLKKQKITIDLPDKPDSRALAAATDRGIDALVAQNKDLAAKSLTEIRDWLKTNAPK